MPINVNDLDIPFVDTKFSPSDRDIYEQVQQNVEVSQQTWIARTSFGFAILGHEHIDTILKDKRWHNALSLIVKLNPYTSEEFKKRRAQAIICLEDQDHSRIKKLVQPAFSPSNIDKLRPYMSQYMNTLIDEVYSRGECDIQKEVFDKYPSNMICKILGVPDDDWLLFNKWTQDTFKNFGMNFSEDTESVIQTQKEFQEYSTKTIEEKRQNLSNDLLSDLIRAEESGDKLSFEELRMLVEAIIVSGIDTTRSQLGLSTLILSKNKDLWHKLSVDHQERSKLIEETIRLDGSLKNVGRFASEDIEYNGVLFPQGTSIIMPIAAANYDSSVFNDPNNFDHQRNNLIKDTLAFGAGIHYCLGTALARAELQEALAVVSSRLPNLEVQEEIIYKDKTETVWGLRSLPVKF